MKRKLSRRFIDICAKCQDETGKECPESDVPDDNFNYRYICSQCGVEYQVIREGEAE